MKIVNILRVFSLMLITIAKAGESLQDKNKIKTVILGVDKSVREKENGKLKNENFSRQSISLWPNIEQDQDLLLLEHVLRDIERGRGKSHRYKKLTKFMYPLFMGVLVAKIVLVPLILKILTAISVSAVVMSKIALITTGFVALKWIFSGNVYDTKDRLEFIFLPTASTGKPYRSASGGFSLWDDQSWSDSNNQYASVTPASVIHKQKKYIPVDLITENPYKSNRGATGGWKTSTSLANSAKDLYYYSQHNYNNNDGKPFL